MGRSTAGTVLHVIPGLSLGGAGRAVIELRRRGLELESGTRDRVLSLAAADPGAIEQAGALDMPVVSQPGSETIASETAAADVVLVHYWNAPELQAFLYGDLPPMRLVFWVQIFGAHPPHVITKDHLEMADLILTTTPSSFGLPVFEQAGMTDGEKSDRAISSIADFGRLDGHAPVAHGGFNVGYVGTVDFVKMHRDYVALSLGVRSPDTRFIVCGSGGAYPVLQREATARDALDRFDFRGHVEDIRSLFETLDVFGYPLCEETYGTSEKSLQEAMYVGVPPIVFPYGGIPDLITHGETGLIVHSADAYADAIEFLRENPEDRDRLGRAGAELIRRRYDATRLAGRILGHLEAVMKMPKRAPSRSRLGPVVVPVEAQSSQRGTALFLRSLGHAGAAFEESLSDSEIDSLLKADLEIAAATPVLQSTASGGILHYRRHFPDDPYLAFWSGLVLAHGQRPALAVSEFVRARKGGMRHWRLDWHLANAAVLAGTGALASEALDRVLEAAPDFPGAHELRIRTSP